MVLYIFVNKYFRIERRGGLKDEDKILVEIKMQLKLFGAKIEEMEHELPVRENG